jgi:hypothetical protein
MTPISISRLLVASLLAGTAALAASSPVGAETVLNQCTGTCGQWQVQDHYPGGPDGATCKYGSDTYLDSIAVNPPALNGPFSYKTKVQWRYKVLYSATGGAYAAYFTSTWQSANASTSVTAGAGTGFSKRTWFAPNSPPTGFFKVQLLMRWQNSAHKSIGTAKVELDAYKPRYNGIDYERIDNCSSLIEV